MMAMDLKAALLSLDTLNDDHWTGDGAPRIDVLKELTGAQDLSRASVINFAPDFNRDSAKNPEDLLMNKPLDADDEEAEEEILETEEAGAEEAEVEDPEDPEDEDPGETEIEEGEVVEDDSFDGELNEADEEYDTYYLVTQPLDVDGTIALIDKMKPDELESFLLGAEKTRNRIQKMIEDLRGKDKQIKVFMQRAKYQLNQKAPDVTNQQAIQTFIKASNAQRAARAQSRSVIINYVGDNQLNPKSPLDQAMGRKPKRGQGRPKTFSRG